MKRKILSAVMAALMIAGMALPGFAYKVGDKVSTYAYTDIVTYINNTPIESFNINWETAVIVEDLADYGFNVVWDPTPGNRNLQVTRNYSKPFSATYVPKASTHKNGDYAGDVLYTDIVTYFEGQKVDSFNINGRTIVYVNDIADFYAQPGTYKYNDSTRTLSLTLKGSAGSTTPTPAPSTTSPLKFTTQPKTVTASANEAVSFNVAVTGGKSPYTYKWEMKKASDTSWSDAGGSAAIYSFTASQALLDGGYMFRCVVTDADGTTVYSDYALLQPKSAPVVTTPLTIVAQPQNQAAATLFETLTYTIGVSGGKAPYYYSWQVSTDGISWYDNGVNNLQTYQLTANIVSTTGIKYVRCLVTDSNYQSIMSTVVTASVIGGGGSSSALAATLIPSYTATVGVPVIGVIVPNITNGSGSYSYEWHYMREGTMVNYAVDTEDTDNDYDFPGGALFAGAVWKIYCVVTDKVTGQKATTNVCTMTVTSGGGGGSTTVTKTVSLTAEVNSYLYKDLIFADIGLPETMTTTVDTTGNTLADYGLGCGYSNSKVTVSGNPTKTGTAKCRVIGTKDGTTYYLDITVTISPSTDLQVSIPSTRTTKVKTEVTFPATVTNGSGSYTYTWYYKRNAGNWTKSGWTGSEYFLGSTLTEPATWYVYCVVTDNNTGKTATSNICTLTVTN